MNKRTSDFQETRMQKKRTMKRLIWVLAAVLTVAAGCKSEKKINSYKDIYSEQPTTIMVAPVVDKAERKVEKYPADAAYNNELNTSTAYMQMTLTRPLVRKGYYVLGTAATKEVMENGGYNQKALRDGNLSELQRACGIDAVLVVTLHRWREENGKWIAMLEYQLRSTKSNHDLMHTWVMAIKAVPTNLKGDPIVMKRDKNFAKEWGFDNGTAQRAFLVEKVNDYVLRDLPTSSTLRQFEKDIYRNANPTYIKYTWSEEGGADVKNCSVEEYEQKAFR